MRTVHPDEAGACVYSSGAGPSGRPRASFESSSFSSRPVMPFRPFARRVSVASVALRCVLPALVVVLAWGCRGAKEVVTPPLTVIVEGTGDLNGGGYPVDVFFYQLTNDTRFERAVLDEFWRGENQVLRDELVAGGTTQVRLYPQGREMQTLEWEPEARFLGIAANLRSPDRNRWRRVYAVDALVGQTLHLSVGRDFLNAEVTDAQ